MDRNAEEWNPGSPLKGVWGWGMGGAVWAAAQGGWSVDIEDFRLTE